LARAPTLKVRFFLLFARNPTAGAFFAVDAAAVLGAAFFAAFLDFAQRALWAAAIFSRASALNVRLVLALPAKLALAGRPGFRFPVVLVPLNSAFTCCSLDISASISTTMCCVFMKPPVSRITHRLNSDARPWVESSSKGLFTSTGLSFLFSGDSSCSGPGPSLTNNKKHLARAKAEA